MISRDALASCASAILVGVAAFAVAGPIAGMVAFLLACVAVTLVGAHAFMNL